MPIDDSPQTTVKHWQACTDVYDFLDQIRLRPGMWLPGGSLRHLEAVLTGYRVALGVHSIDEPFGFWPEDQFVQWLWKHYGRRSSLSWAAEIERATPAGSTPVEEFFRVLDQYRVEQAHPAPRPQTSAEHPGLQAVRIEISRHDWAGMQCGCTGTAAHVPADLLDLISARYPGEATLKAIDNHVMIQSNLMDPAPATTAVLLAALADPSLTTPEARTALLELLLHLVCGDTDQQEECEAAIRGAVWILYRELTTHPSIVARAYAYETLHCLETEHDRLAAFREIVRDRLPAYLH
ncbi:hypothetical protein ACFY04_42835 [Streptomyces sp. NPDC001549]|uniref:hypothetical protein n=1 Tax=Streptomyces sp. NPDC001549 TaxID=3364586 RepID=UPI003690115D